jgi:hypothetical protein
VAECGLAVAPVAWESEGFGAFDAGDLGAEVVVEFAQLESLSLGVRLWSVDCHVKDTEMQLAEVEECVVDVLDADLFVDEIVGDLVAGDVVAA